LTSTPILIFNGVQNKAFIYSILLFQKNDELEMYSPTHKMKECLTNIRISEEMQLQALFLTMTVGYI